MRIAYLPDSFHEVNGVAHTSRHFEAFAERQGLPFLCIRAALPGVRRQVVRGRRGSVETVELARSRTAVRLEKDLYFDLLFWRHFQTIEEALWQFQPDVIHITGPSELGMCGAYFARKMKVPLAASWHTNLHEYSGRRMRWLTRHLGTAGAPVERAAEQGTLEATALLYQLAEVLYAPNVELCELLERVTDRPCHRMPRGVDTGLFTPARRTRPANDGRLVLGYVGRLSVEKNVTLLPRVDAGLRARGIQAEWLIIGHGSEEEHLREALPNARIAGVLRGEDLAEAYANMDLFVFPSHTDTFGNVVLEALASGVPAVVTGGGGPKFIVRDGMTGAIRTDDEFAGAIAELATDPEQLRSMRLEARRYAQTCSWDSVFSRVVEAYPVRSAVVSG